jgi:hypothetical protein
MNRKIIITESDRERIRGLYNEKTKGCCKGSINEDESNCYSPESPQGMQLIGSLAGEIKGLGISAQDVSGADQNTPEVTDAKAKVAQMLNPVLPNASKDEIKKMIQDLKVMRRQKRQDKQPVPQEQPAQVNEQAGALAAWETVKVFLLALPAGVFIAIGAWLILRLLRCHIYEGLGRISVSCGLDIQKSFLVKLAELVFLDFKNLFETDPVLWNCR